VDDGLGHHHEGASAGPAGRYYRSLLGAWNGRFHFEIVDLRALRRQGLAAWLPIGGLAALQRLSGGAWMSTTLAPDGGAAPRSFLHTTRLHEWGTTLFRTSETISLLGDGRGVRMTGTQSVWPALGRGGSYLAVGGVDGSATRATYEVPWFGTLLTQRTEIVPTGLALTQDSAWSHASVLLVRASR
jgi:hypothetical protein